MSFVKGIEYSTKYLTKNWQEFSVVKGGSQEVTGFLEPGPL